MLACKGKERSEALREFFERNKWLNDVLAVQSTLPHHRHRLSQRDWSFLTLFFINIFLTVEK
jgi:hypothetical protein